MSIYFCTLYYKNHLWAIEQRIVDLQVLCVCVCVKNVLACNSLKEKEICWKDIDESHKSICNEYSRPPKKKEISTGYFS